MDHDALRKYFHELKSLKRLALCRDTYPSDQGGDVEDYYESRFPSTQNAELARKRPDLDREMGSLEAISPENGPDDQRSGEVSEIDPYATLTDGK